MQGFSWLRKGKVSAEGSHSLHTQLMIWKRITSPGFSSLKGKRCPCPNLLWVLYWVRSLTYSLPSLGSRSSPHRIDCPSLSSPNPLLSSPWVSPLWLPHSRELEPLETKLHDAGRKSAFARTVHGGPAHRSLGNGISGMKQGLLITV